MMMVQRIFFAAVFATLCSWTGAQIALLPIPTYAPVPSTGIGPTIPPDVGYRVEAFGNGAYLIADGIYQSMFLVSNEGVIVVDAPPTTGQNMLYAIRNVTDLPISHLVYSHAHGDHIGSAYLLIGPGTTIIAHRDTATALESSVNQARPMPNITFTDDYDLCVGNQTLQLSYKGLNHEPGNIFIYAPVQKIIMVVDIIYPGWIPFAHLGEANFVPGFVRAHDQVLAYDFDHLLGGHVNRAGTRDDVLIQKEYVADLYACCVEAVRLSAAPPNATNPLATDSWFAAVAAANPDNLWGLNKYGDDLRGQYCTNVTNEKWLGRLAGADVYEASNAETMLEALKLDFGV